MNSNKPKMNIVKRSLMIVALLAWMSPAFSQEKAKTGQPHPQHQQKQDRVKQLKIAYFTTELALTSAEAEKFWPVYNEMQEKLKTTRKDRWKLSKELKTAEKDADLKQKTNAIFESEAAEIKTRQEYYEKIASTIGYKKATKVMSLEQEFKRELLHRMSEKSHKPAQSSSRHGHHKR